MHSRIGDLRVRDGLRYIHAAAGQKGCVLYGPYIPLKKGDYVVSFHIKCKTNNSQNVCIVDVLADGQTKLAERKLSARDIVLADGIVTVPFSVETEDIFEFRVLSTGRQDLDVRVERPVRLIDGQSGDVDLRYHPGFAKLPFFKTHAASFDLFSHKGFTFDLIDDRIIANYFGARFSIENVEDFQLMGEVFLINEYNFVTKNKIYVIDIGMNIGLTSIYMASKDNVERVYGFEPFQHPFERAQFNFGLNPDLSKKIISSNIGIAESEDRLTVPSSSESTIGVSVKGIATGTGETITLCEASSTLAPIFEEATKAGFEIVLKVDCEGSEFGIFRSLCSSGLIGTVSGIVCEWHKWWSHETQLDIIKPLLDIGFMVIDRTDPTDRHAGLFYAINRHKA